MTSPKLTVHIKPNRSALLIVAVLAAGLGLGLGVVCAPSGPSKAEISTIARRSGDSAITAYKSSKELTSFVSAALEDTVAFYDAKVKAAVKIVIRRDSIPVHDTIWVPRLEQPPTTRDTFFLASGDTLLGADSATIAFPLVVQGGVIVSETTFVKPRPTMIVRNLLIRFDADTIIAALLQTPDGLERFSAAAVRRPSLALSIADAAQIRTQTRTKLGRVLDVAAYGSCILAGIGLGQGDWKIAAAGGAPCAGKLLFSLTK